MPTQEELKKFWEWCGFEYRHEEIVDASSMKVFVTSSWLNSVETSIPDLTLDNLFKYAWRKAIGKLQYLNHWTYRQAEKHLFQLWQDSLKTDDYEDALFWALDKVREETK